MRRLSLGAMLAGAVAVAGCGGGSDGPTAAHRDRSTAAGQARQVREASSVRAADFPAVAGRSLEELAQTVASGPRLGFATSVYVPGTDRVGFGLIDKRGAFVLGKSAIYVARDPGAVARGPYAAPLDSMVTQARFQSRTVAADPASIKRIYATEVRFPRAGSYAILVVTKQGSRLLGAPGRIEVSPGSAVPNIGDRPPLIDTPTVAAVHGDVSKIDTRVPPDDMHKVSFRDVIGRRPVALLFATPALCQSRTCGPVTDIAVQMEHTYGDRMTFIHNEVYVDNMPQNGYRPQLQAFHLQTEPWLFTFDRRGRVAARLEGAFGVSEFRRAVEAALR